MNLNKYINQMDFYWCHYHPKCTNSSEKCKRHHPNTPEEEKQWKAWKVEHNKKQDESPNSSWRKNPVNPNFKLVQNKVISLDSFKNESSTLAAMTREDKLKFKKELLKQKDIILKEKNIDLLLLMDCTYSMKPWIEESANCLVKVIQTVKSKCKFDAEIRAAYVGYRDFGDTGDDKHFDLMDYTTDHEKVSKKISDSKARGGGDAAEDVKGALDKALSLANKAPFLHIFLICDAPTHGSQYHDGVSDNHKN